MVGSCYGGIRSEQCRWVLIVDIGDIRDSLGGDIEEVRRDDPAHGEDEVGTYEGTCVGFNRQACTRECAVVFRAERTLMECTCYILF